MTFNFCFYLPTCREDDEDDKDDEEVGAPASPPAKQADSSTSTTSPSSVVARKRGATAIALAPNTEYVFPIF